MNITEDKLKSAIQIALGSKGLHTEHTEELESLLIHHIKALSVGGFESVQLPIGTEVTLKENGSNKKITGHCSYMGKPKGYLVDGEGIYLDEDFE